MSNSKTLQKYRKITKTYRLFNSIETSEINTIRKWIPNVYNALTEESNQIKSSEHLELKPQL